MFDMSTTRLRVTSAPVSEPLSLSETKVFLRIDDDNDDALILRAIAVAREAAEQYLGIAMLPQSLSFALDAPEDEMIALPVGPATSITSITSTDDQGNATLWAASNYRLSADGYRVLLKQGVCGVLLTIVYDAAMASNAAALPALLKQGMLHHIAVLVEARDGSGVMPSMSIQCYHPFRRMAV